MIDTFAFFSYFSRLKLNLIKFEIAGIEVLKGIQVVVWGMRSIDLNNDLLKILGTWISGAEIERGKKSFWDFNRYSTSIAKVENENTAREFRYF